MGQVISYELCNEYSSSSTSTSLAKECVTPRMSKPSNQKLTQLFKQTGGWPLDHVDIANTLITQGHKNMPFTGCNDQVNFTLFLAPVHLTQWQMFETSATTKGEKLQVNRSQFGSDRFCLKTGLIHRINCLSKAGNFR